MLYKCNVSTGSLFQSDRHNILTPLQHVILYIYVYFILHIVTVLFRMQIKLNKLPLTCSFRPEYAAAVWTQYGE